MNSLRCKIRKINASGDFYSFLGTHLDLSTHHLNSFLLLLVNPSIVSPCCTAQIRLSGHYRDLYIKKLLLWGFLYIVFLFVFYGLRRELANCESNLILLPADIFWLPGQNLRSQGQSFALWSVLHPSSHVSSAQPYILFKTNPWASLRLFIKSTRKCIYSPGCCMFNIDLALNNVIGLYLFFINHKELSVDWFTLRSICNFADRYFSYGIFYITTYIEWLPIRAQGVSTVI